MRNVVVKVGCGCGRNGKGSKAGGRGYTYGLWLLLLYTLGTCSRCAAWCKSVLQECKGSKAVRRVTPLECVISLLQSLVHLDGCVMSLLILSIDGWFDRNGRSAKAARPAAEGTLVAFGCCYTAWPLRASQSKMVEPSG